MLWWLQTLLKVQPSIYIPVDSKEGKGETCYRLRNLRPLFKKNQLICFANLMFGTSVWNQQDKTWNINIYYHEKITLFKNRFSGRSITGRKICTIFFHNTMQDIAGFTNANKPNIIAPEIILSFSLVTLN